MNDVTELATTHILVNVPKILNNCLTDQIIQNVQGQVSAVYSSILSSSVDDFGSLEIFSVNSRRGCIVVEISVGILENNLPPEFDVEKFKDFLYGVGKSIGPVSYSINGRSVSKSTCVMKITLSEILASKNRSRDMMRLIDLPSNEVKKHFLKCSSYFNGDLPKYISFQKILDDVAGILEEKSFTQFKTENPSGLSGVNYSLISNKDGRLAWRPYELIHPVIYVSLVNTICEEKNWNFIVNRLSEFEGGVVECCSSPVLSIDDKTDVAAQVMSWWQKVEQRSLAYSLEYTHILHTDVTDCYGSIYTHSIAWALHGVEEAKEKRRDNALLGNRIDFHIQSSRYGQTNGIAQGSVLMDFIAEIVLSYVDHEINAELEGQDDFRILRYRDDYRVFANSDDRAEEVLKVISDKLRAVGMRLGVSKTYTSRNVVEGSIKPDKLAGIDLQDLGKNNAKTIQKQLLRLHSFGRKFPNSGALKRLVSEFHRNVSLQKDVPEDLEVQVAIATDIAFVSPATFPAVAGILSHLISLSPSGEKASLWKKVRKKMERVPYNGYLEIWLQRVTRPKAVNINFSSDEAICKIVGGEEASLWENGWVSSNALIKALDVSRIVVSSAEDAGEVIEPEEIELFTQNACLY